MIANAILTAIAQTPPPQLESIIREPTLTPGVFYHGSPHTDLADFKSKAAVLGGGTYRPGISLTELPTYAAVYSVVRGGAAVGRIYAVEIVTQRPFTLPHGFFAENTEDEAFEHALYSELRARGHDCVIAEQDHSGRIWELVVLDPAIVRRRGTLNCPTKPSTFVRANCTKVVYCDRDIWPAMNADVLKLFQVDCLVDPDQGDALVIDQALLRMKSRRAELRKKRPKPRRRP